MDHRAHPAHPDPLEHLILEDISLLLSLLVFDSAPTRDGVKSGE